MMKCIFLPMAILNATAASAAVIEFTERSEWDAAVGAYSTIDFILPPSGTPVTNQYAHLGATFVGGYSFESGLFRNDDWGLQSLGGTWVHFETPQRWLAVDFPGRIRINLYRDDELIYASEFFNVFQTGRFAGVLSAVEFDMAYLHREGDINHVAIDDLYFGVPSPGTLALLAVAGLLGPRRRRVGG